jgi:hypothetical protein
VWGKAKTQHTKTRDYNNNNINTKIIKSPHHLLYINTHAHNQYI